MKIARARYSNKNERAMLHADNALPLPIALPEPPTIAEPIAEPPTIAAPGPIAAPTSRYHHPDLTARRKTWLDEPSEWDNVVIPFRAPREQTG